MVKSLQNISITWTDKNLYYIVGLLEGEGSFQKRGKRGVAIQCHMTDLDILQKLKKAIGYGYICGPYYNAKKHHKLRYMYKFGDSKLVIVLLNTILPLMGKRRQSQIKNCINHYILNPKHLFHLKNIHTKQEVYVDNLTKFCNDNNLSMSNLWRTKVGQRKQHKGWIQIQ